MTTSQILQRAVEAHQTGRIEEAKQLYDQVLIQNSKEPNALHLRGVVALQENELNTAIALIQRAIEFCKGDAGFFNNLGTAFLRNHQEIQAIESFKNALLLNENDLNLLLNLAQAFRQKGDVSKAIEVAKHACHVAPEAASSLHLLGVLCAELGELSQAIVHLKAAVQTSPKDVNYHCDLANAYMESGREAKAEEVFRAAIELSPNHSAAHDGLGTSLLRLEDYPNAEAELRFAIELNPKVATYWHHLGRVLEKREAFSDAHRCFEKSVELNPKLVSGLCDLGHSFNRREEFVHSSHCFLQSLLIQPEDVNVLRYVADSFFAQEEFEKATNYFRRILELDHDDHEVCYRLGICYAKQAMFQESLDLFLKARPSFEDSRDFNLSLGRIFKVARRPEEAKEIFEKLLASNSDDVEALIELAKLHLVGRECRSCAYLLEKAYQIDPENLEVLRSLADIYADLNEFERVVGFCQQALAIEGDDVAFLLRQVFAKQKTCQWDGLQEQIERLLELPKRKGDQALPLLFMQLPATPMQLKEIAQNWALFLEDLQSTELKEEPFIHRIGTSRRTTGKAKIRVGYLSGDFRQHPVSQLLVEMLEKHTRSEFEIFGYTTNNWEESGLGKRIYQAFDKTENLRELDWRKGAAKIFEDEIDILIDLAGYTMGMRCDVMVARPAPIQVNYLGFPGTWGASCMDYIIADEFVIPASSHADFNEQVVSLPHCFLANPTFSPLAADEKLSRRQCGLPDEAFIFSSFNSTFKIGPVVWETWMKILKAVPNSVLWNNVTNPSSFQRLQQAAEKSGVAAERIICAKWAKTRTEHLARLGAADLMLDAWPYNAHASASDAMLAGLPVLTLSGETFASRVAGSLLNGLGMTDLITHDPTSYEQRAIELAQSPSELSAVKRRLREAVEQSPVFDSGQFTLNIESAYRKMYDTWAQQETPRSFSID